MRPLAYKGAVIILANILSNPNTHQKFKEEGKVKRSSLKKLVAGIAVVGMGVFFSPGISAAAEDTALKISGFIDASYSDASYVSSTFALDQVEIDLEKKLNDKLSLRADIEYVNGVSGTFDNMLEQGYVTYVIDPEGVDITFGKFNAPIGFELLDAPDMYQFSHALVFTYGLPTNLTGIMGAYTFNDQVDLVLYVVNGWDNNTEDNDSKTIGGRVGIAPMEGVSVGLSYITGSEVTNTADKRTVFDIDATVTMIDKLTIGVELNFGDEDNAGDGVTDSEWTAFLLMGHYDFDDTYGVTVRYDSFDDEGGARLNDGDGFKEKQTAIAVAGTMVLAENAGMIVEYQSIDSDQKVFRNGAEDSTRTIALEFTYKF